jgi:hypothetical protein
MAIAYSEFDEGNVLWFQMQFIDDVTQEPINPTNVAFGYRVNGGEINSFIYGASDPENAMTNPVEGTFLIPIPTLGSPGTWVWTWQSTGLGAAQKSGSITVRPIPMLLLSS